MTDPWCATCNDSGHVETVFGIRMREQNLQAAAGSETHRICPACGGRVAVPPQLLRVLLRAASGCATDRERLARATEEAAAVLPRCGHRGPTVSPPTRGPVVCQNAPGHVARHRWEDDAEQIRVEWDDDIIYA